MTYNFHVQRVAGIVYKVKKEYDIKKWKFDGLELEPVEDIINVVLNDIAACNDKFAYQFSTHMYLYIARLPLSNVHHLTVTIGDEYLRLSIRPSVTGYCEDVTKYIQTITFIDYVHGQFDRYIEDYFNRNDIVKLIKDIKRVLK